MTVQELINELEKVEDKSITVYLESEGVLTSTCVDCSLFLFLLFGSED